MGVLETRWKYGGCKYNSLNEMMEKLLKEANEQIIRIDLGEIENNRDERNFAKFRLMQIERSFHGCIHEEYRAIYNSLWSQVYRLEHQGKYTNPYLKSILDRLRAMK